MKKYKYEIDGDIFEVTVRSADEDAAVVEVNGQAYNVNIERSDKLESRPVVQRPAAPPVERINPVAPPSSGGGASKRPSAGGGAIPSPLPGVIVRILVKEGDEVKAGQSVMVLEAMKMENNVEATRDGKVTSIAVREGDSVMEGDALLTIGG